MQTSLTETDSSSATNPSMLPMDTAVKRTFLRRLGSGAFGAGTLGLIGLLGGFSVPLAALVFFLAGRGQPVAPTDGGLIALVFNGLVLGIATLIGAVQGVAGLLIGLLLGFVLNTIGKQNDHSRRMLIAAALLSVASLGCGFYLASGLVK